MEIHDRLKKQYKVGTGTYMFLGLIVVCFVLLFPFAVVWSLNTLFAVGLSYTWQTWLASFILTAVVSGSIVRQK